MDDIQIGTMKLILFVRNGLLPMSNLARFSILPISDGMFPVKSLFAGYNSWWTVANTQKMLESELYLRHAFLTIPSD